MKIAFIHISKGIVNRGSEISIDLLADFLAKKHQVFVFQGGKPLKNKKFHQVQIRIGDFNIYKPRNLLGKILERLYLDTANWKIVYFSLKVLPYLLKEKFDIVVPTNGFWQVLICKIARLLKGSKIVVFGRAGIGFHDSDNLKLGPDLFVALTKQAKKWASKINKRVKIIYIPNGIDINCYLSCKKKIFKKDKPVILTVAALTAYKRIDLVIKAVANMKRKSFLMIVGKGELKNNLTQMAKRLLGKDFAIRSFPSSYMPSVYASCDVFTLVSESQDSFPRVILEALACNKPLVLRDDPIKKEIAGKAAFYVNPENIEAYAFALDEALKWNNSMTAKKRIALFDIKNIAKKTEKVFLSLLEK